MRRYFATILFVAMLLNLHGQPESQKGYFGISAGVAIPVGNFASTDVNDETPGYANSGFNGFLSTHIHIKDYIGFAGMIGYSKNPYDVQSFNENYRNQNPGVQYEFSASDYEMISLLGGAFVSIPQGIMDINLKGYIGVSVATMPSTNSFIYSGEAGDPHRQIETLKNRSTAFTYGGGVNLIFYTKKNLAILIDASYLQAKPEFNALEIRLYEDGQLTGISGVDFQQKFQVINLGAGIAFTF